MIFTIIETNTLYIIMKRAIVNTITLVFPEFLSKMERKTAT